MANVSLLYRRIAPLFAGVFILLLTIDTHASDAQYQRYQQKKNELVTVNEEYEKAKVGYQSAKIELSTATSKLDSLKANVEAERSRLDKLRDFEAENPEMDFSDKINQQRAQWKQANQDYLTNREYVASLTSKVNQYKTQHDIAFNKSKHLQATLQRISDDIAGAQVNDKLRQIQTSRRITIKVRETCSLSVTKDNCRDQARVKAERQAAERGSLVVVDSVTEIKNFNLTKDEARSRVSARVSDIQIIKDTYDLTADKTGWQVDYEISAMVTPVITEKMREELKRQAMSSLGAGYTATSTSAAPLVESPADNRLRAKHEQQEREAAAQQQLENERIARRQAAEELEIIKQQASRRAEQEVSRQASDEEKSRTRRVFGGW